MAGSNTSEHGTSGVGGPATSALFGGVGGLALTPNGDGLAICDRDTHRVLYVDLHTSIITLVAGSPTGVSGLTGDGGFASDALLIGPEGAAYDSQGNLVFTEIGANRVRYVDATGKISIIAGSPTGASGISGLGGAATSALLNAPRDVAIDALDNVYIADSSNRVLKITASTGFLVLVAGRTDGSGGCGPWSGAAVGSALNYPIGIAVDRAGGGIAIADSYNNHVVYVTFSTGIITSIAGDPQCNWGGYGGDYGPAVNARLSTPSKLAYDSRGNLVIGDYFNQAIRVIGFYPWGTPPSQTATPTSASTPSTTPTHVSPSASSTIPYFGDSY